MEVLSVDYDGKSYIMKEDKELKNFLIYESSDDVSSDIKGYNLVEVFPSDFFDVSYDYFMNFIKNKIKE